MGLNIVITSGGISERIDDVRKITNMSSGKLGATICETMLREIPNSVDKIYYVCSAKSVLPHNKEKIECVFTEGVYDLKDIVEQLLQNNRIDYFIHAMAVSDYGADYISDFDSLSKQIADKVWNFEEITSQGELQDVIYKILKNPCDKISNEKKLSSSKDNMIVALKKTPKVISTIKQLQPSVKLIGFKLLSNVSEEKLVEKATELMRKNNCDYVVANDLANIGEGTHKAIIIGADGDKIFVNSKEEIAQEIVNIVK